MQQRLGYMFGLFGGLLGTPGAAQPDLRWVKQFGTGGTDFAYALAPDGAGGAFVAGYVSPVAFLARYDGDGAQAWYVLLAAEDNYYTNAHALATGEAGGVFIAGETTGNLGGHQVHGFSDAFVGRFEGGGDLDWATLFGSHDFWNEPHFWDQAYALAGDGEGGVFVGGSSGFGITYPLLARYDSAGNQAWMINFDDLYEGSISALASAGALGVFVTGISGNSAFFALYDGAGQQVWIKPIDGVSAMAPAAERDVFIAGGVNGDAFIARYDSAGDQVWFRQFGTAGGDGASALAPDGNGGAYVAGLTTGDLGGPNAGGTDAFIALYDGDGNQVWVTQLGSGDEDTATSLASDGAGGVIVAGYTDGSLGGPNLGGTDAFLARFGDVCYADCDGGGTLDLFDFLCFVNLFNAGDDTADCDASGSLDLFDLLCFTNAFNAGC